jgi:hypothetical protein
MKKLLALAVVALFATGSAYAQDKAKADKPAAQKTAAPKTLTATGTVKSVAADSIVVTDKDGKDHTFGVDAKTAVQAKGAGTKTAAAKAQGKAGISITDAVKSGDKVTVKYHDMGGTMHAASVRVM